MIHPALSLDNMEHASRVIDPVFLNSPQISFDTLSQQLGAQLTLKVETLNPIRCFKGRGTDYFTQRLENDGELVTASAGNFGQGLARACGLRGRKVTIFASPYANALKLERMRSFGATVMLAGDDFDGAKIHAREYAERNGLHFVEDGREPAITEGAATIGVELLRNGNEFDAMLIPVGNGAMINGIGSWVKAKSPRTRIVGICAALAPSMELSWKSGSVTETETAATIADGIGVRVPVPAALDHMRGSVDEILLVSEERILEGMRLILFHTGLLVEPSGAVGVACLLQHGERFRNQLLATIVCGGNVTNEQFQEWFR